MLWKGRRESTNVEDRRGSGGGGRSYVPGGRGIRLGLGGIVVLVVASLILKKNPLELLAMLEGQAPPQSAQPQPAPPGGAPAPQDDAAKFAAVVLADTEDVWTELLRARGRTYEPPTLVLFRDATETACGYESAAVGPFYCPPDRRVYIDLSFFDELHSRFGASGDFAQAYVIAHEVGHHVQNIGGISDDVDRLRRGASREGANELSVRQELQADCFAGAWAHHAQARMHVLEPGDIDEALGAAAAIGDDTLQRESGRRVQPESWTHGSSEMRTRWFRKGWDSGDVMACDTFAPETL